MEPSSKWNRHACCALYILHAPNHEMIIYEILLSGFGGQAATDQLAAIDRAYCISKRLINFE
jgi:hypothetical protein